MIDLKQLQEELADEQKRSTNLVRYLRIIADLYEQHGSVEQTAQQLSQILDGNENPVTAKALVDCVRQGMLRLLIIIELDWRERKISGESNGH
jgi:hypothetical protein